MKVGFLNSWISFLSLDLKFMWEITTPLSVGDSRNSQSKIIQQKHETYYAEWL